MNIRNLNTKINRNIQAIILVILSGLYGFSSIYGSLDAYDYVVNSIVVFLVLLAVWALFIHKNHSNFASYLVLLLLGFIDHAFNFIKWGFSLNFETGFVGAFPWLDFVLMLGSIYLILISISVFLDDGFKFNKECFRFDQLIVLFPILMFLTYGINVLLAVLVVEFIACNYRPIASHFLMFSKSIIIPFTFFRLWYQNGISSLNIGNWILAILALYVIVLIIIDLINDYKYFKSSQSDACVIN